ncbi:MAG: NAD(+)/NADH kinase [Lachnospiraceae bacterium]|nr:NAD(+)/NADH kinase [Lachnospiraceae bacterium]
MDKFFIITNRAKDKDLQVTSTIVEYLQEQGKSCATYEIGSSGNDGNQQAQGYTNPSMIPEGTECILVLGGDGTMIRAARDVAGRGIPLFGVNLGTLGYLAEVDRNSVFHALDHLMDDRYTTERRMMLQGRVFRGKNFIGESIALNDIVIARKSGLKVLQFDNYVNGDYLNTYRADGVILATPTGSTGYSLSAGGPIVSPQASLFVMTPLAPHSLNKRSVILPPEDVISVQLGPGREVDQEEAMVYFDGDAKLPLVTGDRVEISRAVLDTVFIKIHHSSFLEVLRRKMTDL